jgi:hypothetical protein
VPTWLDVAIEPAYACQFFHLPDGSKPRKLAVFLIPVPGDFVFCRFRGMILAVTYDQYGLTVVKLRLLPRP